MIGPSVTRIYLQSLLQNISLYIPATLPRPRPRPTLEYVNDIIAATIESHHTWSKSGIWENNTSMIPNVIMYPLLDMWHGSFPPLLWKQFDLFIALNKAQTKEQRILISSQIQIYFSLFSHITCKLLLQTSNIIKHFNQKIYMYIF